MSVVATHEIAAGVFCFGPRGRWQTNLYLVRSEGSWTLIDAGWAGDAPEIVRAAETTFGPATPPQAIFLTHCHPDHSGAARELARHWSCPVYVHAQELPLALGDYAALRAHAAPLDAWLILPLLRALGRERCQRILREGSLRGVAQAFDPQRELPGLADWRVIPTPGHTPGHTAFFRSRDHVLICGDALATVELNGPLSLLAPKPGLSGPPWCSTWDWGKAQAALLQLAELEPFVLACGHGPPMIGAGTASALRNFVAELVPPTAAPVIPVTVQPQSNH